MSEQNVDLVRRSFDAFDRGDVAAAIEPFSPDAEIRRVEPELATWRGPAGFLEALRDWTEGFDEFEARGEEFIDAGDAVVVRVHQRARGQTSGAVVEADFWFVHRISDGRVVSLEMYADEAKAFEGRERKSGDRNVEVVRRAYEHLEPGRDRDRRP
jgi:ketosteroid isomerase-like protein